MGLKADLLDAKIKAADDVGLPPPDVSEGSYAEREAHYSSRAIINAMRDANFTITQLKAPVIVEELRTPEQPVNIELETLLGEYQPVLKLLKKIGSPLGLGDIIDILEGGAKLAGLDINKDAGGLQSTGYVYIGEDPDSQGSFDVDDEDGQREFTTVRLLDDDARKIL